MVNVKEKLANGWIHSRVIIEIMGKPESHVKDAMKLYMDNIAKDEEIEVITSEYSDVTPQETMFTAFIETEILTKTSEKLVWFCFDYLPSSVEIIEPREIRYTANGFSNFLNDLQTRLHTVAGEVKVNAQANKQLMDNANRLLSNLISVIINSKDSTLEEIANLSGLQKDQLKPYLDVLVKRGAVVLENDVYKKKK